MRRTNRQQWRHALNDTTLPDDIPIVINTLEDALFMDKINDISFEIGDRLVVLLEHQSTINPNVALRLLLYIGRIYEKIIEDKNIYSSKKLSIPQPEFYVLYNGTAPYPDENTIKLSDMFKSIEPLGLKDKEHPVLELEVKIYNINEGKNKAIAKKCRLLSHYSAFIAKVREFEKAGLVRKEAMKKAIYYCREHDILKEFLEKHGKEVANMLLTEWNWDDAKQVWHDEGRDETRIEVARKALAKGSTFEFIQEITGLDMETIASL